MRKLAAVSPALKTSFEAARATLEVNINSLVNLLVQNINLTLNISKEH